MLRNASFAAAAALLAALLGLAGCGSSSHTTAPTPPAGNTLADLRAMLASTVVPGTVLPPNADTTATLLATMDVDGLRAASATFVVGASLAQAGTVSVEGNSGGGGGEIDLDRLTVNYGGTQSTYTTLVSHPLGVNLAFDGSTFHRFTATGSATVSALVDSIRAVTLPTLATPAASADVPRASDLAVTWSDAGTDTTVYVIAAVGSTVDSAKIALGVLVRDVAGATSIPAARLGALPAGNATLAVTRYRLAYHTPGGRKVGLACMGTRTRALTLN